FVYRRYLDYGVFESLRDMKERIAREVERKGLEDNIKLGRGGIREIEFIGQSFQLIRGGREPRLQERGIRRVLDLLGEAGYLPRDDVAALKAAYVFLRRLENRLQMRSDAQTHDLPQDPVERARLAAAMGFSDTATFDAELARHRGRVQQIFDGVFIGPRHAKVSAARASGLDAVWRGGEEEEARRALAAQGYPDAEATLALLKSFRAAPSSRLLSEQGRRRLDELVPAMVRAAAATSTPHATLERLLRIVEAVGRRTTYLSLLVETPAALEHLARVCAASSWVAELVARRPLLLDELIDPRVFQTAPALEGYATELAAALARADAGDGEARMEALAEFQQASIMRVAAADIGGVLPLMKVSDHLTAIAEHVVRAVLEIARAELEARHGRPHRDGREARFAVVGYGKLGGYELGYGSDLDLVFLHDVESSTDMTDGPKPVEAGVYFARLAQRILNLLTLPTASGPLYRVDTRLRPAGAKGLPVTSLAAFERYQREEAWTWEHQALLRARAIAGDGSLCADFERARRRVLAVPRDAETLRCDVRDMRARMRREHVRQASRGFDIKHDPGGITDIEFLVQYWVLREAHRHPDLLAWPDVIRFLEGLARHRIISETDAALLSTSYRTLRARVHALSLQGREAVVEAEAFAEERQGVLRLWQEVFGGSDEPEGNDQSREGHRPL
ncbi:MAG TPA: bifunctional [glutamate--ammonia ligase]-adenylyl-L-tyrosine phosphorylase/[glutamate--ammonia-ligase] adenylyltransferase, partial [Gammaproteobacteria bacterium]|nr:bifunctional [glutamate--ammonia ligase]-adenylyl-L-tyrosine phosphorylase/[glutamate--ammonia-ligase] adenylyltransferase [Gammaproteobacteria bacterium]